MAKIELGIKRTCQACGVVFYDLNKYPIVCPKCDVEFDPEAVLKSRRARLPVPEEPEAKLKNDASEVGGEDDISDVDIEDDEDVILPEVDDEDEIGVDVDDDSDFGVEDSEEDEKLAED
ncbi:MAG: TIGR02300 family protein [Rhodospirillaceae bacterium]|nr:TIGR02300 family protein [Rhodospirillaceae bacterium]